MTGAELFLAAAILIALCVAAGWMVGGMRREPAPEPPLAATWWACPSCHSVNEGVAGPEERCYRCGRAPDPTTIQQLDTDADFEVVQHFGSSRKGGWDHEVHWTDDRPMTDGEPDDAAHVEVAGDPAASRSVDE